MSRTFGSISSSGPTRGFLGYIAITNPTEANDGRNDSNDTETFTTIGVECEGEGIGEGFMVKAQEQET